MSALLLLFAICGNGNEVQDHFDMLEVNHFHNQYGAPVFVQLIYWDWFPEDCRFHVQGWRMMKDAYDKTDAAHRREYEAGVDRWLRRVSNISERSRIRSRMEYKGKFVGGRLYPIKHHCTGRYQVRFRDDSGVDRLITANLFRETYTTYDPEVDDRKYLPNNARRGLTTPPLFTTSSSSFFFLNDDARSDHHPQTDGFLADSRVAEQSIDVRNLGQ